MINYFLPKFNLMNLHLYFASLFSQHKSWVQPNVCIKGVYDCFPNCKLNGGRAMFGERATKAEMDEVFSSFAKCNIVPRLTFSNMLAKVEWLDEPYAKRMLEVAAEYHGEVIVYSHEIGKEVRKRYGMPIILSTSRPLETPDEVNKALETYDVVVLNYNHHKDPEFLKAINCIKRTEVMVNETCQPNCPNRPGHHMMVSKSQVDDRVLQTRCLFKNDNNKFKNADVRKLANSFGIENFKIVGREQPASELVNDFCYYLILPEYRETVKEEIKEKFFTD